MTRKKILFYVKDIGGGTGRFLTTLNSLQNIFNIEMVVFTHGDLNKYNLKGYSTGINTGKQKYISIFSAMIFGINFFSFSNYIKKNNPDFIFAIDLYANIIALLYKFFHPKTRLIISTHINLKEHILAGRSKIMGTILFLLIKKLYNKADFHYAPSRELTDQLRNVFNIDKNKTISIPYPVDVQKILMLAKEKVMKQGQTKNTPPDKNINLITMARFDEQKNFKSLFCAIKKIHTTNKQILLWIMGEGKLYKKLQEEIKRLKIRSYVHFLGWQKNSYQYLKRADIFILITNYEGYPYSLLEAQVLGLPIIVSDVDFGPREILGKQYVGLIKNNITDEIVKKLSFFIKNKIYKRKQPQPPMKISKVYNAWKQYFSLFTYKSDK